MSTTVNQESCSEVIVKGIQYRDQGILSLISPEHLERLVQICSEDGMAVLEYKDTGMVFMAAKHDEDFVISQVIRKKETEQK
jgi:hypothetical protein